MESGLGRLARLPVVFDTALGLVAGEENRLSGIGMDTLLNMAAIKALTSSS